MDWNRASGRALVQTRGADRVDPEFADLRDHERGRREKDREVAAAAAARRARAAKVQRQLDKLYWDIMHLPDQERLDGAEWVRRQVKALVPAGADFTKAWNKGFANATRLSATAWRESAAKPPGLGARRDPKPAAPSRASVAAAPRRNTGRHRPDAAPAIIELVAAFSRELTAVTVARVLVGMDDDAVPHKLRTSQWWGASRPRSKSALLGDITDLVRAGELVQAPGRKLTVK
ncbi:hypothetical protein [Paraconexibacter sp. AEG42_29]